MRLCKYFILFLLFFSMDVSLVKGFEEHPANGEGVKADSFKKAFNFVVLDRYPYSWINETGEYEGFFVEFVQAFNQTSQFNLDIQILSQNRYLNDLYSKSREISFQVNVIGTPINIPENFEIIAPLFCDSLILVPQRGDHFEKAEDMKGRSVGVLTDDPSIQRYQNLGGNVIELPNTLDLLNLMALGRIDVVWTTQFALINFLKNAPLNFNLPENEKERFGNELALTNFQVLLNVNAGLLTEDEVLD